MVTMEQNSQKSAPAKYHWGVHSTAAMVDYHPFFWLQTKSKTYMGPTKRHSCQSRSWSCTTDGSTGQRCHRNGRCTPAQAYRCHSAGGGRSHALPRSSHSRQPPISPVNTLRMLYPCPWWQELPTNHILELELHIKPTKKIKFKMHLNISKLVWYIYVHFQDTSLVHPPSALSGFKSMTPALIPEACWCCGSKSPCRRVGWPQIQL